MAILDPLLKSVSRSFYLSLRVLPAAIRPSMGNAYLLCRAADTVADTTLLPAGRRLELVREIRDLFSVFPLPEARAAALAATLKEEIAAEPSAERLLILRYDECLRHFATLSNTDRALVQRVVVGVATGMMMDLETFGADSESVVALNTDGDLERYIGWIGGEPGRFWTDLCAAHGVRFASGEPAMRDLAHRFGTGLQMVNILRDVRADLALGRCYIPETRLRAAGLTAEDLKTIKDEAAFRGLYNGMIDETVERIRDGLRYVERLPRLSLSLRAAAWWPLALALKTLALLRNAESVLGNASPSKVARREVYWLLATSLLELPFNALLRADFRDLSEPAD